MRRLAALSGILLLILVQSACLPCGCEQATLVGVEGVTLKITFDSSINPFSKDKFTVTMIKNGGVTLIHGTYKESSGTIRFDAERDLPFLSVKSGEINSLACDSPRPGQFTVTPPAPPGGASVPLTFQCTKKG